MNCGLTVQILPFLIGALAGGIIGVAACLFTFWVTDAS
jgi:hypothetical protein